MKRCSVCGLDKAIASFRPHRRPCRDCINASRRAQRAADPQSASVKARAYYQRRWEQDPERERSKLRQYRKEQDPQRRANTRRQWLYGITAEQYNEMVENQASRCALCCKDDELVVDHCHAEGHVRRLLCRNCNTGLGMFKDNPHVMERAAQYVLKGRKNMRVVCVDPGGTSGFFIWEDGEVYPSQTNDAGAYEKLASARADVFVTEDYRPARSSNPQPAQVIGAVKLVTAQRGAVYRTYAPSVAKPMAPNRLLARLGWHRPELPHASDAARLLVCWALLDAPKDLPIVAQVRAAKLQEAV